MSSKFIASLEKSAFVAPVARLLGKAALRIGSGNLTKPLTKTDKVMGALGAGGSALGAVSDASDYGAKFRSQYR